MSPEIISFVARALVQCGLLLMLFRKDKYEGDKTLFRTQGWGAGSVVFIVVIVNVVILVLSSLPKYFDLPHIIYRYYLYFPHLLLSIVFVGLFRLGLKQRLAKLGLGFTREKRFIGYALGLGCVAFLASSLTHYLVKGHFVPIDTGFSHYVKGVLNNAFSVDAILYLFWVVIWAPTIEECIYRGIVYSPYRRKYGPTAAIVITSLLFSASHPQGVFILTSVLLCVLYEETESIIYPSIAHGTYNLLYTLARLFA